MILCGGSFRHSAHHSKSWRYVLGGIKTAAVINIGAATVVALIGAGGYCQSTMTGIRLDDAGLILERAVPAAALIILVQLLFKWAEGAIVSRVSTPDRTFTKE
jgi:ABC-type proline/glycine betaine transport system permease subunit